MGNKRNNVILNYSTRYKINILESILKTTKWLNNQTTGGDKTNLLYGIMSNSICRHPSPFAERELNSFHCPLWVWVELGDLLPNNRIWKGKNNNFTMENTTLTKWSKLLSSVISWLPVEISIISDMQMILL